ncbi:6-hydroxymethylpterin diphosphokinase MptE-like protein [Aliarcobacter cryaerophilus]|uniref:6-hydroxymethylpterin diphosphokinase MptE-like protein n=1 Tax=Aliarcobacter cryaerophilus TaxID=28198 RepID=UPI003DA31351
MKYNIMNYKLNKELLNTKKLHNTMFKTNAFVFANGPSLSKIDLEKIKNLQKNEDYKVFCVNSFIRSFDQVIIPDYYILSDPVYFGEDIDLLKPGRYEELQEDLEKIEKYKITLFIPVQFKAFVDKKKIDTKIYYFNDYEFFWSNNVVDILKPRSYLSMTAYKAIAIASYLGFNKIYICGFDNNWFKTIEVDENNSLFYYNNHASLQACSGKHFVKPNEARNIGNLLYQHSFLFNNLYNFPKNIINLDKESLTDAFVKKHNLDVYKIK